MALDIEGLNFCAEPRCVQADACPISAVHAKIEFRRRGIGETLLRILEEHASSRGALRATLHAQTYVRSFYASHGYVAEGETFDEAGIEHIAMQKDISEPRSERGQNGEEGPIVGNREDERGLF